MNDGADLRADGKIHESITRNISHNLEIAEKCFRCLLNMLGGDAGERAGGQQNFIVANETDFGKILDLCISNAQLIENVHDLLLDGTVGRQSANGESYATNRADLESCAGLSHPLIGIGDNHDLNREFRENIVDLMILSVQCWEQCTKKNKIELAEESNIWRISVDGGRLRVRSMDRYLAVNKLPKMPRWHDVLKTAYFVLDAVSCDSPIRRKLEESLDHMLSIMRKRSLRRAGH